MGAMAPQITSCMIVYSIVYSDADQRKHQSSTSLAFVQGIHRGPVNSPHKWPVTRKMFPFDDVIMQTSILLHTLVHTYSLEICNVSQMRFQIIHYNKTEWHSHVVNSLFWVSYDKVFQFLIECTLGWGELVIRPKIELHGDSLACWWTGLFEGILIKGPMFSWKSDTCWILFSSLGYEIKCLSKNWIFFLENELMARTGFDSLWLTHLPLVAHIYVGDLGQHWLR